MVDSVFFQRTAQLILQDNRSGYDKKLPGHPSKEARTALVLCGPVVGEVTESIANVLLEIDVDATITCTAHSSAHPAVHCVKNLKKCVPEVFRLVGLMPGTKYRISFGPLADVQQQELQLRDCTVRTMPPAHQISRLRIIALSCDRPARMEKGQENPWDRLAGDCTVRTMPPAHQISRLRIIALSCDRPARMEKGQENPWDRLAEVCKADACDVMLHLGDQVYTKECDWMANAVRIMDICEKPGINSDVRERAEAEAAARLQMAYRATWYPEGIATVLSRSSHLMIWSDNDVANDFTVLKNKEGLQAYTASFLRVGMRVYRMYQRQLWDSECVTSQHKLEAMQGVEEWHFHRYGPCGVFLIDMRGNRIRPDGVQKDGPILSARQRAAIEQAFGAQHGLTCMLICSEIPFVGDPPDVIRKKAQKMTFLKDHWPYQIDELTWLLDLCFSWKAGARGRDVFLLAGDIHVSVDSTITDNVTAQTIRCITTSPITNHVCGFYPELTGSLNDRYSYEHKPMPGMRTYCELDLNFAGHNCKANVNLVGIPTKTRNDEDPHDVLVLCGPVIGTVTDTTANVLIETDAPVTLTCKAKPRGAGEVVIDTRKLKKCSPEVFKLEGLQPGTEYDISFDPLATLQVAELRRRGCVVRTLPTESEVRQLRIIALSCDRPAEMREGQENPWGRVAKICKDGQCDIMLHLGDQVYTKENDWKSSAMRVMDIAEKLENHLEDKSAHSLMHKIEKEASEKLQLAYRGTWYDDGVATALSHSSHLMIWSDNDVANDFTILKKKDGTQAYSPSFLRVGMRVYRMYQRQLWDPDCVTNLGKLEEAGAVEEWHFHRYGSCGIFLIDMRGNRIGPDGKQKEGPILSARQREAIEQAFAENGLTCMLVCSEIPFVSTAPDLIRQQAEKIVFLKDHWPYQVDELTWLLDLCFSFKAAAPGREVIMLGGDIHVSVDSEIKDSTTGQSIRHITTSPITNHVSKFFPADTGSINDRYSYVHKALPGMRTYCTIDLFLNDSAVSADVNLVGVPTEVPGEKQD